MSRRTLLSIAYVALSATTASANGVAEGRILQLLARTSDGLHYVFLDTPTTGKPPCATGPYFIIKDENSQTGQMQMAMLLTAIGSEKVVRIDGVGTCVRWGDCEDIGLVTLLP